MNYTRTLKEYCLQNKGSLFNISEEYENHFKMMPKKTYYKILNRLEEEGYLHKESHGVYFIFDDLEKKKNNDRVVRHYTSGQHGIIVGYHWYNEIGITNYNDGKIVIYTNIPMKTKTQNIGKHHLEQFNVLKFDKAISSIIYALELIEKGPSIIDLDILQWNSMINSYLLEYGAYAYSEAIMNREYKYATICTLCNRLTQLGIEPQGCIEFYNKVYVKPSSKVQVNPKTKEIYER